MLYPCVKCGGLALANGACPHCSYRDTDEGLAIVNWIYSLPDDQREATVRSEPEQNWPATVVRSYPAISQAEANARFAWEASVLGLAGYRPVSQTWDSGGATIGDLAAFGAFAALKSRTGSLTVTFARNVEAPATGQTQRCPDCAEEVLAEARICRFCRHEFVQQPQGTVE